MSARLPAWLVRSLLAASLLFATEILLWADPSGRAVADWPRLIVGYLALAALLLDLMARYRVRDVFGLLVLTGFYGLLTSLLLNPQIALVDVPRTWATRVLGAQTLLGLAGLVLFLKLTAGATGQSLRLSPTKNLFHFLVVYSQHLLIASGITGLLWGLWVRWLATFTELTPATPPLTTVLLVAGVALLLILILWWLAAQRATTLSPDSLRLNLIEWLALLVVLIGLLLTNLAHIDSVSLVVLLAMAVYCALVLWFQAREGSPALLDASLPVKLTSPLLPVSSALVFLVAGAVGYSLPFDEATAPFGLMIALFAAFGLVWLPTVSLVLGVRSYRRLGRQRRL